MQYLCLAVILLSLVFTFLWSLTYKFSINKSKFLKRTSLQVCGALNIDKETYLGIIKAVYFILLGVLLNLAFIKYYKVDILKSFNFSNIGKGSIAMLIAFIIIVEITFLVSIVIVMGILKGDLRKAISGVKWISFNAKHPMYTAILRPIFIVIVESIFYYIVLLDILMKQFSMSFIVSLIISTILFTLGKALIAKTKDEAVIFGSWNFIMFLCGGLILGYTGSIIIPLIVYLVSTSFWVFKQ